MTGQATVTDHSPGTYPVNLRLRGRRVLVVGGGRIAAAKLGRLLPTGARLTVVAPEAVAAIAEDPRVTWHQRAYRRGEVASYRLAITCTGDPDTDAQVFGDGEAAGVWVNSADDVDNCSLFLPALARSGPVSVAIGTDGTSPALASHLRRWLQSELDHGVVDLAALASDIRAELRWRVGTSEHPAWAPTLDAGGPDGRSLLDVVRNDGVEAARVILRRALGLDGPTSEFSGDADAVAVTP